MARLIKFALCTLTVLLAACATQRPTSSFNLDSADAQLVDLSHFLGSVAATEATFVVFNPAQNTVIRHNPKRAAQRFLPASTFKIPNSLIALETGVVSGSEHVLPWPGRVPENAVFWPPSWSRDHSLRSAFGRSVVWYYQAVAREIGAQRMQAYVNQFDYGNRNPGGGIDQFWLSGDLRISADEQVRFLARFYYNQLGLDEKSTQVVKDIMRLRTTDNYQLSGKTGTADLSNSNTLLWLVGYLEQDDGVWFYALNLEGKSAWGEWGEPSKRQALVVRLLGEVGVL